MEGWEDMNVITEGDQVKIKLEVNARTILYPVMVQSNLCWNSVHNRLIAIRAAWARTWRIQPYLASLRNGSGQKLGGGVREAC